MIAMADPWTTGDRRCCRAAAGVRYLLPEAPARRHGVGDPEHQRGCRGRHHGARSGRRLGRARARIVRCALDHPPALDRSLDEAEVAYYFSAIALGLLGGGADHAGLGGAGADGHDPARFRSGPTIRACSRRYRHQAVTLDSAIADEAVLRAQLEQLLGGTVVGVKVRRIDLVNDTTSVDVRFRRATERPVP